MWGSQRDGPDAPRGGDAAGNGKSAPDRPPRAFLAAPAPVYAAPMLRFAEQVGEETHAALLARVRAALGHRYDVTREIGRGGMAVVFLAHDRQVHRDVAIKVLREGSGDPAGAERFQREIDLVSQLQHPHIVALHDAGVAGGLHYFVMPCLSGETLGRRLAREGRLQPGEVVHIVRELADALDHAHQRGVVHRDVKPDNILLQDGQPVLADFGIALAAGRDVGALTEPGVAPGTPRYMAPEQSGSSADVGPATDIYALACVACEMLAGPTSPDEPVRRTRMRPRRGHYAHTRDAQLARLRREVRGILRRALAPDPASRYPNGRAFADALAHAVARAAARRRRVLAGIATLAGVVAALALRTFGVPQPAGPSQRVKLTAHGRVEQVVSTRDGRWMAFAVSTDSTYVVVREVSGGKEDTVLTGDCCLTMDWSPDGERLLVTNNRGAFVIPRRGGPPQTISRATSMPPGVFAYWVPPDGRRVSLHASDVGRRNLLLVDVATEDTATMPLRDVWAIMEIAWAPDGRRLAASLAYGEPLEYAIAMITPDGAVTDLDRGPDRFSSPQWSADGRSLFYSRVGAEGATIRHVRFARFGRGHDAPADVHADFDALPVLAGFVRFSASADGARALYARGHRYANLVLVQPRDSGTVRTTPLTHGTADLWAPAVSPDGHRVAFVRMVDGAGELFTMPLGGGPESQVTTRARIARSSRLAWSPRGDSIAFIAMRDGRLQVHVYALATGSLRWFPATRASPVSGHLSWAPSSRIAYLIVDRSNVHLLDPATGREEPMIPDAPPGTFMLGPRFSPDGHHLAFFWSRQTGDGGIWVADLRDGRVARVAGGSGAPLGWSVDGRAIDAGFRVIERHAASGAGRPAIIARLPYREGSCTPAGIRRPGGYVCTVADFASDVYAIEPFARR